ncbi:MAG: GNAT family N-acetyltransferase [Clostridia bacterium]|nr:GNAT family N-acetyltransferase [Clostridia bacterium]
MTYYDDGTLVIRDMTQEDAHCITEEELAQGWHASVEKYLMRIGDHAQGRAIAMTAQYAGQAAGYVSLYAHAPSGPYAGTGIPEIVDLGVLEKYRGRGIGSRLLDAAEALAAQRGDRVCLGVGLHSGYGAAQRMYVRRGYVPDGSGVWYGDAVCEPYGPCVNDDDLVLYMEKRLG